MRQNDYITNEYLDTKLELMLVRFERHVTDLVTGFNEKIVGVCDHVKSIDEKATRIDQNVSEINRKLNGVSIDVFNLKEGLKEKTNKAETLKLKKRIVVIEANIL